MIYHRVSRAYYHLYVPKYTPTRLKNGQVFSKVTFMFGDVAEWLEQYIDIHSSEKAMLVIVGLAVGCCCLGVLVGGIWIGGRLFFRTETVIVMRDVNAE